jgi:AraC family transcriptional regulator
VGYASGDVFHDPRTTLHDRDEMAAAETHGTARLNANRLVADSTGLGWRDAYLSLARESPWSATLPSLPCVGLALCVQSSARIRRRLDGSELEEADLLPRTFGLIPPDLPGSWDLAGTPEIELVYVRREAFDDLATAEYGAEPSGVELDVRLGFRNDLLEQLMVALLDAVRADRDVPTSGLWADHLVRLVALELLRSHSNVGHRRRRSGPDAPPAVQAARDYVEAHLADDLPLVDVAAAAGIAPHRLTRAFREQLGTTPHQYVIARRVERAASALRSSTTPIAIVAAECGFASQSHLTTAFRQRYGTTPAAYREG